MDNMLKIVCFCILVVEIQNGNECLAGTEFVQEKSDLQMHAISCPALAFLISSLHV